MFTFIILSMVTTMASGLLKAAVSSIYTTGDSPFSGLSDRSRESMKQAKNPIDQMSNEDNLDCFDEFSQKLMESLEQTYTSAAGCASNSKEQIWQQFHITRLTTLCDIWKTFLDAVKCEVDPLVQQHVNQELYSSIIKSRCGCHNTAAAKAASMSTEGENIVGYAAGYVRFTLQKNMRDRGPNPLHFLWNVLVGWPSMVKKAHF